jgi:2'-5' RNA ligase
MTSYDWKAVGATSLAVTLPEAEPAIGRHRRAHTPSGPEGMPAHATLIAPFVHSSRLGDDDLDAIRDALRPFRPFEVTLASFGCFEHIGCLYLEPEPREPFVRMSQALLAAYPEVEYPPEGATRIIPHVTIGGHLTAEQQDEIKQELAPYLPIRARADSVVLVERGDDGRWFDRERFEL